MWFRVCLHFIWHIASIGTPSYVSQHTVTLRSESFWQWKKKTHQYVSHCGHLSKGNCKHATCHNHKDNKTLTILKAMSYVQSSCLKFEEQPKILWVKAKLQQEKKGELAEIDYQLIVEMKDLREWDPRGKKEPSKKEVPSFSECWREIPLEGWPYLNKGRVCELQRHPYP